MGWTVWVSLTPQSVAYGGPATFGWGSRKRSSSETTLKTSLRPLVLQMRTMSCRVGSRGGMNHPPPQAWSPPCSPLVGGPPA